MKINFNAILKDIDGKDMTVPVKFKIHPETGQEFKGEDGQPLVLKSESVKLSTVCVNALMANKRDETLSGEEKLSRYILASKIKQAKGTLEVTAEEVVKIKKLVGEFMSTLIVGAVYQQFEK